LYQHALRDVIGRCLYGVDINPMAAELCRVSLWLEALEPGRPLSFLDHHIRVGNSLLGATPELITAGLPDEAFTAIEGDDKKACAVLKKRNKAERKVVGGLFAEEDEEIQQHLQRVAAAWEELPDDRPEDIRAKEMAFRRHEQTEEYRRKKQLADAWCASFVFKKCFRELGRDSSVGGMTQRHLDYLASGRALPADLAAEAERLAGEYQFFHWHLAFPEVSAKGGFDCLLGNPPFVNAIEGGMDSKTKSLTRFLHPRLAGTADLGYFFLDHVTALVRARGRIGLIQPRAVLNASPVAGLRRSLVLGLRPNMIYAPQRSDLFPGAAVFVCALVLGPDQECRVGRDSELQVTVWGRGVVESDNWWLAVGRILGDTAATMPTVGPAVGSTFEIGASMTTGDAYELKPFVVDSECVPGKKLVTTGLIEPNQCLWGTAVCRYLKSDFRYPRVAAEGGTTKSLQRRLEKAARPKIIVAGLSKQVECFLDEHGEFVGAVSTYSIFHPSNDVEALRRLCDFLLTKPVSDRFTAELGGNAMGGGNTTMKREFLEALPLPAGIVSR
jgi:hypothetical protein